MAGTVKFPKDLCPLLAQYLPCKTQLLSKEFQKLGKEVFASLTVEQQFDAVELHLEDRRLLIESLNRQLAQLKHKHESAKWFLKKHVQPNCKHPSEVETTWERETDYGTEKHRRCCTCGRHLIFRPEYPGRGYRQFP